jgi:DNA-binding transcriptional MocR family regulator
LPDNISEEEAVDILARQFGVLLMLGWPFGANGHLRLSYGSIPPAQAIAAIDKLKNGFACLLELSQSRKKLSDETKK